jgi:hypothetical protein
MAPTPAPLRTTPSAVILEGVPVTGSVPVPPRPVLLLPVTIKATPPEAVIMVPPSWANKIPGKLDCVMVKVPGGAVRFWPVPALRGYWA